MVTLRSQTRAVAGGRETGKSSPPEPPDLAGLEFCKYMSYGLSWEKLVLPDKFGCALMRRKLREVKLRVAGGGERRACGVEVVADEYGDVYLAAGWWKFARTNGLDQGQLLFFRYDGIALITVTVLDGRPSPNQNDDEEEDSAEGSSSAPAPAPAPTSTGSSSGTAEASTDDDNLAEATSGTGEASTDDDNQAEASTDDDNNLAESLFSVMLMKCHFGVKQAQYMQVPAWFQEAHGYAQRSRVVLQMRGESWTVNLKHNKRGKGAIRSGFRYGWHQFIVDNHLALGDTCFFHALPEARRGEDHVLRVEVRKQDGTIVR